MVQTMLAAPMPRGRGSLAYRTLPDHLDRDRVNGKYHLVFVSYYPSVQLIKKSIILRRTGRYYVTLLACCVREDLNPSRFFDQTYEVLDYRELWSLLCATRPACVHAFIHPWIFGLLAVTAKTFTGVRTVIDVNDSLLFLHHDPNHAECAMERAILRRADAFTHKMPPAAINEMRRVWVLDTPDAQIHALPLPELFTGGHSRHRPNSATVSMVFAGGIMPYELARARGHEGHIFDPLIETLCANGCRLTLYNNQNAREMFWHEHRHYFDYAERLPNFRFEEGLPFFALPEKLAEHDFGLYYENSPASSYNPKHFQYNMATKVFSYLEAGLPVLVPYSAAYIRDWILDNNLGLVYRLEEWSKFLKLLENIDYQQLRDNVLAFREKNNMTGTLPLLAKTYGTVSN